MNIEIDLPTSTWNRQLECRPAERTEQRLVLPTEVVLLRPRDQRLLAIEFGEALGTRPRILVSQPCTSPRIFIDLSLGSSVLGKPPLQEIQCVWTHLPLRRVDGPQYDPPFAALPAPIVAGMERHWRDVLEFGNGAPTREAITSHYRILASSAHPAEGGSTVAMAELNQARDDALKEIQ